MTESEEQAEQARLRAKEIAQHGIALSKPVDIFKRRLEYSLHLVRRYDLPQVRALTQPHIPRIPSEHTTTFSKVKYLTHWFKHDFFTWIDRPKCGKCGEGTVGDMKGYGKASEKELGDGGRRVEVYGCGNCEDGVGRFVRYQHGEPLLVTKGGRCGEWANCFGMILRVCGFEIREVVDWTDHVWVEVWMDELGRWIHVDCCEDEVDKMGLYEKGWGKKLTYVIAIGRLGIVDVTKGYVKCWKDTLARRTIMDEEQLKVIIDKMNNDIVNSLSPDDQVLAKRIGRKASEPKETVDEKLSGRVSGSKEWIESRGEQG